MHKKQNASPNKQIKKLRSTFISFLVWVLCALELIVNSLQSVKIHLQDADIGTLMYIKSVLLMMRSLGGSHCISTLRQRLDERKCMHATSFYVNSKMLTRCVMSFFNKQLQVTIHPFTHSPSLLPSFRSPHITLKVYYYCGSVSWVLVEKAEIFVGNPNVDPRRTLSCFCLHLCSSVKTSYKG